MNEMSLPHVLSQSVQVNILAKGKQTYLLSKHGGSSVLVIIMPGLLDASPTFVGGFTVLFPLDVVVHNVSKDYRLIYSQLLPFQFQFLIKSRGVNTFKKPSIFS